MNITASMPNIGILSVARDDPIFIGFDETGYRYWNYIDERQKSSEKEPVRIRYKDLANGNKSIYLDIYQKGKRVYEFLKLYLVPETSTETKIQNENTLIAANAIKSQRILELTNDVAGIRNNSHKAKMLLTDYLIVYRDLQYAKGHHSVKQWVAATIHVIKLWKPNATLRDVDKQWCEEFIAWLLNDYVTFKGTICLILPHWD